MSAARGRLHDISLRFKLGDMKREDVISELETLTTFWRGDDTEVEALEFWRTSIPMKGVIGRRSTSCAPPSRRTPIGIDPPNPG